MPRPPTSPALRPAADPVFHVFAEKKKKRKVEAEEGDETEEAALGFELHATSPTGAKEEREKKKKRRQREDAGQAEGEGPVGVLAAEPTPTLAVETSKAAVATVPCGEGQLVSAEEFRKKFHISAGRQGQELPEPVQTFDQAPFRKKLRAALKDAGFAAPSPIQAQGWPIAVSGRDLVAVAQTGSGKTLGFLLPAFRSVGLARDAADGVDAKPGVAEPLVLVLAPTRELVQQIEVECVKFGACAKVRSQVVFGGSPKQPQVLALKKTPPEVIVATPGRLQDLMDMGVVSLRRVSLLVLDEADRMLDMGFEPEIAKILAHITTANRQTLMFTATWPKAVQKLAEKYLSDDFMHVNVGETQELAANKAVSQEFFQLDDSEKEDKLWQILCSLPDNAKMIVFGNTKRRVEGLMKSFSGRGFSPVALHGDKPQWERERDLVAFTSGSCWLLFATDVCARGLDIKDVTHIVNFDMARDVEGYVHRIGRTGRAGASGTSITFWNPAYDMDCSPTLAKIAHEAGQTVPTFLEKAVAKQMVVKNKAWKY